MAVIYQSSGSSRLVGLLWYSSITCCWCGNLWRKRSWLTALFLWCEEKLARNAEDEMFLTPLRTRWRFLRVWSRTTDGSSLSLSQLCSRLCQACLFVFVFLASMLNKYKNAEGFQSKLLQHAQFSLKGNKENLTPSQDVIHTSVSRTLWNGAETSHEVCHRKTRSEHLVHSSRSASS